MTHISGEWANPNLPMKRFPHGDILVVQGPGSFLPSIPIQPASPIVECMVRWLVGPRKWVDTIIGLLWGLSGLAGGINRTELSERTIFGQADSANRTMMNVI